MLEFLRNCTRLTDYESTIDFIKVKFSARGYPTSDLPVIPFSKRNDDLEKAHTTSQSANKPLTIVSKFDSSKKFARACKNHWQMLSGNSETRKHLYQKPVQFTFTQLHTDFQLTIFPVGLSTNRSLFT